MLVVSLAAAWSPAPQPQPYTQHPQHFQRPFVATFRLQLHDPPIDCNIAPFFSRSELLTVRLPLPFQLAVRPFRGTMSVFHDGSGLRAGDVLRCCTTIQRPSLLDSLMSKPVCKRFFLADGQTPEHVVEALTANSQQFTDDILVVVERPLDGI